MPRSSSVFSGTEDERDSASLARSAAARTPVPVRTTQAPPRPADSKNSLIIDFLRRGIPRINWKRTDTTLDLSQRLKKVIYIESVREWLVI